MEPLRPDDPMRLGDYELVARLGSGGMGHVYLGRSRGGREVAVKVVRPELADEPSFRRRFADEVRSARRVGGFYTAQVVDADTDADAPWLATAYISGPSLAAAVAERGRLPSAEVVRIGAGIAEGLAAVHARGIVHRDLKPGNVLLAADGPRLIDFGIARALDETSYTPSHTVLGTAAFMSPEQASGRTVDHRSDVFSLGCVLAYAATGRRSFGTGGSAEVAYRVVYEEPDLSGLDEPLAELVARCLAKDPDARPSVGEIVELLGGTALPPPTTSGSAADPVAPTALVPPTQIPPTQSPPTPHAVASDGQVFELTTRRMRLARSWTYLLRLSLVPLGVAALLVFGQVVSLPTPSLPDLLWHFVPLAAVLVVLFLSTRHRHKAHDRIAVGDHGIMLVDGRQLRLRNRSIFVPWVRLTRARLVDEDDLYAITVTFKTELGPVDIWGQQHAAYRYADGYVLTWLRVRTPGQAAVVDGLRRALVHHGGALVEPG